MLAASLLSIACACTFTFAQQGGGGGAATQPGGGGRGRANNTPGMTAAERDAFVGVRTTNTYQPMPRKDASGNLVKQAPVGVHDMTDDIRSEYRLDPFYTKYLKINGILVIGSKRVSDYAFLEAAYTMDHQFEYSPQWVRDMFEKLKIHLAILASIEFTMDLPENNRGGRNSALADAYFQDMRSRGLGGMPWCSCAEENLLNLQGDRYGGPQGLQGQGENITIHEFSHTTASAIGVTQGAQAGAGGPGRGRQSGPFWDALRKALKDSNSPGDANTPPGRNYVWNKEHGRNGQMGNVYGSTNEQEYWAEGAQAWFDNANPNNSGGLSVRDDVKKKDPELAALLTEIYGDGEWRYIKTTAKKPDGTPMRPPEELAHLAGMDRSKIPVFNNNNSPRVQAAATQPDIARGGRGGGGGGAGRGGRGNRGGAANQPGAATRPGTILP
jgi:alpha-glucosidase